MDHNTYKDNQSNANITDNVNHLDDVDHNVVIDFNPETDNIADKQGNVLVLGQEADGICSTYSSLLTGDSQIFVDKGKGPMVYDFDSNEQVIDVDDSFHASSL
ncbi:hypothetical protein QVD17_00014 [Tagetes erecta]|uniref:Uncharacterized protein n=1 Tax=Tagetes erecta TaxID=13708 RepID=A0AAD8L9C9_TARER|nr:hypothetical protein QVD17_00013 [Tagetes erecta]KAK1434278.1 hypothetical protein QVD17_00014 [Tagetes erecta]